ncbi:MAG: hypothetical protein Sapg2KO_13870 [Saprospiraceae bacterium]
MIPVGHSTAISSINYSPDGQLLLTSDQTDVKIWNQEGQLIRHFQNVGALENATFSPDGKSILIQTGKKVSLWSLEGVESLKLGVPIDRTINKAFFTPKGTSIITLSESSATHPYTLIRWDLEGVFLQSISFPKGRRCVDVSSDGKELLFVNIENDLEIWDTSGVLQKSFDAGYDNYFNTAFFSPNGQNILTSGGINGVWKLWSREGRLLKEIIAEDSDIEKMTFSPSSQQFLVCRSDSTALIYDLNGKVLQTFSGFRDPLTYGCFSADGQYVFFSDWSGNITILTINGQLVRRIPGIGAQLNFPTIELSSNGTHLLRNNNDGNIQLWDLENQILQHLNLKTPVKSLGAAAFSPNGNQILLGEDSDSGRLAMIDLQGQVQKIIKTHNGRVSDVAFAPDGASFISAQWNGPVKIWNHDGQQLNDGFSKDELGSSGRLAFSPDGGTLVTWHHFMTGGAYFNDSLGKQGERIRSRIRRVMSIKFSAVEQKMLVSGSAGDYDFEIFDLDGNLLSGSGLGYNYYADAEFSPDGQLIAAASYSPSKPFAFIYHSDSNLIDTLKGHKAGVTSIAFFPSGKYLATGSKDGTNRFWSVETGLELATFIPIGTEDWVVTTPQGLYDASPGAAALLSYTVYYENNIEVIALEQLKARYYEPGLLTKLLGFSDERIRPVEQLEQVPLYPALRAEIKNNQLLVELKERNGGMGGISVFINDKEVIAPDESNDSDQLKRRAFDLEAYHKLMYQHPDSTNIVRVKSYNKEGWLTSPNLDLTYKMPSVKAKGAGNGTNSSPALLNADLDPKLFVLTIGTSNYRGNKLDLKYADQDATAMAQAMQAVSSKLFDGGAGVEVHCFSTASPDSTGLEQTPIKWQFSNKENIKNTFEDIKKKAKAEDVLMVYLSGHGITYGSASKSQFHYLTQGIADDNLSDQALRSAYTISSEELTGWINDIPALKQVLIIDACNSGQIVENLTSGTKNLNSSQIRALDRMKDRTGMFILSGSASDKVSYEASEYGQGLLTYALLQGMLGFASRKTAEGEYIDVMKLFQFARDEVPRLAASVKGVQTPMLGFPTRGASFDLGLLDDQAKAKIPISNRKPVFIRSIFFNEETFDDDQNLVSALQTALQKETAAGKDADLIYFDVNSYPKAYAVRGLYTVNDGKVALRAKLLYGSERIDLEAISADDPKRLVKSLMRSIKKKLKTEKITAPKSE